MARDAGGDYEGRSPPAKLSIAIPTASTTPPRKTRPSAGRLAAEFVGRATAGVVGGYGATYLLATAASLWSPLPAATTTYVVGSLALLPYVGVVLWAFAARSVVRAWAAPVAIGIVCGLAILAQRLAA